MIPFPNSLFGRFVLIIVIPLILLQALITYIFYQRHWENVNKYMHSAVVAELQSIVSIYNQALDHNEREKIRFDWRYVFNISEISKQDHRTINLGDIILPLQEMAGRAINKQIIVSYVNDKKTIRCDIDMLDFILSLEFSSKRIQSPTTYIFVFWVLGISTILAVISLLFMRNQLRSIIILAETADRLGKGQEVTAFTPRGAKEIRIAGIAFIRMKKRIERQIKYRTELLNHISHDLRTPITRMKLQLALLNDEETVNNLNQNIKEMEHMLTQYLNFAKGEGNENSQLVDIVSILKTTIYSFKNEKVQFHTNINSLAVNIRFNAFQRAINNLIDNAIKFAKNTVLVQLTANANELSITIEDDGMGIPANLYKVVFKPFYKQDKQKEGFGLGLAIAKSIIYAHGGKITLGQSLYNGLKVEIILPL